MTGSLRELRPGVWELRVSTGRDPVTGRYRGKSRTFRGSETKAGEALARLVTEVRDGKHSSTKGTVGHLLDAYLAKLVTDGRSPTTLRTYQSNINHTIRPALGRIELRKLGAGDLDRLYATMAAKGAKPGTIRQHHAILSGALKQAWKWGWIPENIAERASPPRVKKNRVKPPTVTELALLINTAVTGEPYTLPPEEIERRATMAALRDDGYTYLEIARRTGVATSTPHYLLHHARPRPGFQPNLELAVMLLVAATTGLRRGELAGLRWDAVNLADATLDVSPTVIDLYGQDRKWAVKGTKTDEDRTVSLDPVTCAVLQAHHARMADLHPGLSPESFVWSQSADCRDPYRPDRITGYTRRLKKRAGLDHVKLHSLRHFSVTELVSAGVDIAQVAGRHGHADASVTLSVYSHWQQAKDRQAAEIMGARAALIAGPLAPVASRES